MTSAVAFQCRLWASSIRETKEVRTMTRARTSTTRKPTRAARNSFTSRRNPILVSAGAAPDTIRQCRPEEEDDRGGQAEEDAERNRDLHPLGRCGARRQSDERAGDRGEQEQQEQRLPPSAAPIMAIIFTSPRPIPSTLRTSL